MQSTLGLMQHIIAAVDFCYKIVTSGSKIQAIELLQHTETGIFCTTILEYNLCDFIYILLKARSNQ